jgi:hypothetical protein
MVCTYSSLAMNLCDVLEAHRQLVKAELRWLMNSLFYRDPQNRIDDAKQP